MLTRKQAQEKECPYKVAGYFANSDATIELAPGMSNCRANNCPKWRDYEFGSGFLCPEEQDYIEKYNRGMSSETIEQCRKKHGVKACTNCPDRYGYCV